MRAFAPPASRRLRGSFKLFGRDKFGDCAMMVAPTTPMSQRLVVSDVNDSDRKGRDNSCSN